MTERQDRAGGRAPLARLLVWGGVLAAIVAFGRAVLYVWLADDAFLGFRYARNLVDGAGLVLNVGERSAGPASPLWTLFVALGLRLGGSAEATSLTGGLACFAVLLGLLLVAHARAPLRIGGGAVPLALLLAAGHRDLAIYATGGLETSALTTCLLAATLTVLEAAPDDRRRATAGGVLFGLAALLRPDALLLAAIAALSMARERRWRPLVAFVLALGVTWSPLTAWLAVRSGHLAPVLLAKGDFVDWLQGATYLGTYVARYWPLLLALPGLVLLRGRARDLLVVSPLLYIVYIASTGGDRLFAEQLVPVTPLLLIAVERTAMAWSATSSRPRVVLATATTAVLGMAVTPSPVHGATRVQGIADERALSTLANATEYEYEAGIVARYWGGLPIRVALYGGQSRFAYSGHVPYVIEADGVTFTQLRQSDALLAFPTTGAQRLRLNMEVPNVTVRFRDITARVLYWDPVLLDELAARGAVVPDYPAILDVMTPFAITLPRRYAQNELAKAKRFYFDHVDDPVRLRAFEEAVALAEP